MQPGDKVQFKTGSPEMVIVNDRGDGTVELTWFDADAKSIRTDVASKIALEPAPEDDGMPVSFA